MEDEGVRKHCMKVPGTLNHFTCKYCGVTTRGGGVTRMKLHLSGNDPKKNVKRCEKCPPEVRDEMRMLLQEAEMKKKSKHAMEDTIRREMRATLGPVDEENEFGTDMEQELYKTMKKSRQEAAAATWRSGPGGGSGSQPPRGPISPSLYRSDSARQPPVPTASHLSLKKRLGKMVSRFFIHENIPANKVKSHHFHNMMHEAGEVGKHKSQRH